MRGKIYDVFSEMRKPEQTKTEIAAQRAEIFAESLLQQYILNFVLNAR